MSKDKGHKKASTKSQKFDDALEEVGAIADKLLAQNRECIAVIKKQQRALAVASKTNKEFIEKLKTLSDIRDVETAPSYIM